MMSGFRWSENLARGLFFAAVLFVGSVFAQDFTSMGISDVVSVADKMLSSENYAQAIPALEEVVRRTAELTTSSGRETLQKARFQLARACYQTGGFARGMEVLEDYLKAEPRPDEALALRMMAQGYLDQEKWDQVAEYAKKALDLPKITKDDRLNANLLLGQALFRQEKWADCIAPLKFVADNAPEGKINKVSQIMVVRALVESGHWKELFGRIPRLYRTDAKYDITLNITLMVAGKALFEKGDPDDYLNALMLYRMVLPREELLAFSEKNKKKLQVELEKKRKRKGSESQIEAIQEQIAQIEESMQTLKDLPPYEDEVSFRVGQIYTELKRYWEGYALFDRLYKHSPKSDIGEASMLQTVLILYEMKDSGRAEKRVMEYLDENPTGTYASTMIMLAMSDNLRKQNIDRVVAFQKYMDQLPKASDKDGVKTQADLHYLLAFGFFQKKEYKQAEDQFAVIIEKYPESPSYGDAIYFSGMANMMQGKYEKALKYFVQYQKEVSRGEYYPTSVFREAVCLFGLGRISEAEAVFKKFIKKFPSDPLVSEAYAMWGDIEAAKDGRDDPTTPDVDEYDPHTLDRAISDYRKAIDRASIPQQASYAAFQAAKVYKLEYKWQEIIDLMNYYMELLGDKADVAQAVFWVGQAQLELGQTEAAIDAYLDAIERFGNDPSKVGVDKIVRELVNVSKQYLSDEDRESLVVRLKLILTDVKQGEDTLRLRLSVAIASIMGDQIVAKLGEGLLRKNQDLKITSPITLALMCDAAVKLGDTNQMARLFDYFIENFEDSDEVWHAYRAKVYEVLAQKDYKQALQYIDEVQGIFGVEHFMSWAQLLKADTLYRMGKYAESEEAYNTVVGVAEWRGAPFAEAVYGMGKCRYAKGDYKTAHSFFQRTYLLFKNYAGGRWAADAYLKAAVCLDKLDRPEDAVKTLDKMLADSYVNTLPQAQVAREMKKKFEDTL
jgi:tetratricopeptide (TPR) repeat protein